MIISTHNSFISRRHWRLMLLTLIFLTGQWLAIVQPVSAAAPVQSTVVDMADCGGNTCEHEAADYCDSICALGNGCSPQIGGNTVFLLPKAGYVQADYRTGYQFHYAEPIYHPPIPVHA